MSLTIQREFPYFSSLHFQGAFLIPRRCEGPLLYASPPHNKHFKGSIPVSLVLWPQCLAQSLAQIICIDWSVHGSIHCTNGAENGESCQALTTLHRHTSTMAGMDSMPFSETVRFLDNCRFVKVSRYLRIPNGLLWENSSRLSANLRTDIFSDGTVNRVGTPIAILF